MYLCKRIVQAAGRHPMKYELANMPWAAQGMHGRTVCHRVIPFPDIQLVFPATLGHEKPGPVFLFVATANCAALQVHFFRHRLGFQKSWRANALPITPEQRCAILALKSKMS